LPIKDIDFTSAKGKKRKLDQSLEGAIPDESTVIVKEESRPTDQ